MTTYRIDAPDGKTYRIDGPAGASQEDIQAEVIRQNPHLAVPAASTEQTPSLTPDQIAAHAKKAGVSNFRAEHPFLAGLTDFVGGVNSVPRAVVRQVAPNSDYVTMPGSDPSSFASMAGQVLDPTSLALGGGAFKAATAPPAVAKLAPFFKSIIGGGAAGGAVGGIEGHPVAGAEYGAVGGGVLHPLAAGAGKVWNAGATFASGAEGQVVNYLNDVFKGDKAAVANALANLRSYLPGEQVVPSMVTGTGGARLGALEAKARSGENVAEQFKAIDQGNQTARSDALASRVNVQTVNPGTPQQRTVNVPQEVRSRVTAPLYEAAGQQIVPVDSQLATLLTGPAMQDVAGRVSESLKQAVVNAKVQGIKGPTLGTPGRPAPITDFAVEGSVPQGPTPQTLSGEELQRLKSAIDGELLAAKNGKQSPLGLQNVNTAELTKARSQLIDWMDNSVPGWQHARQKFAQGSKLVNETNWMGGLLDAINKPILAEGSAAFNAYVKNAPQTFVKETGLPRFDSPAEVINALSPRGQSVFNNVNNSLTRQMESNSNLATPGSVLPGMQNILDNTAKATPSYISMALSAVRKAASIGGMAMDKKAQTILDTAMTNPAALADLIRAVPPAERVAVVNKVFAGLRTPQMRSLLSSQLATQASQPQE